MSLPQKGFPSLCAAVTRCFGRFRAQRVGILPRDARRRRRLSRRPDARCGCSSARCAYFPRRTPWCTATCAGATGASRARSGGSRARSRGPASAPGDRVAFLAPNVPELLVAHFAVLRIGAALVAINTRLHADEVGYILDHSGARFVFCDPELAPLVLEAPPRSRRGRSFVNVEDPVAGVTGRPLDGPSYAEFVARRRRRCRSASSSTTRSASPRSTTRRARPGRPKGVMYTHRGAYLNALGEMHRARPRPRQRLPLDAADVPLQRLVLPVGGDRRRRHPRACCATIDPARDPAPDPRRGRHAPERRADRAADARRGPRGAGRALRPAAARGDRRRAAVADAARAHGRARRARHPPLRAHRDLRPARRSARCSATGRGSTSRAARA